MNDAPSFTLDAPIATLLLPEGKPDKKPLDQPEHRLSFFVDGFFDRVIEGPSYYTAVDHSGPVGNKTDSKELRAIRRLRWEQRQRAMGIKPDQLDWYVVQFDRLTFKPIAICWIELKWGKNDATQGQRDTMRHLGQRGQVCGVARSIADCLQYLRAAGFVLHGNADNIAIEVQMRLDAAHAAAPAKLAKRAAQRKKGGGKPRAPRYTGRGITSGMLVGR